MTVSIKPQPGELKPPLLRFIPVQLIGLIPDSVLPKAKCICPAAMPKGRKGNTPELAAQLLFDFKVVHGDYLPLQCLSSMTRVTPTVVLFLLLDFFSLKRYHVPHLVTRKHTCTVNTYTISHVVRHWDLKQFKASYKKCL